MAAQACGFTVIVLTVMAFLYGGLTLHAAERTPSSRPAGPAGPVVLTEEALRLHRSCLVIDGHNDLPWAVRKHAAGDFSRMDLARPQPTIHTDIPRLRQGGVGAQFWAAYVPSHPTDGRSPTVWVLEQIDLIHRMVRRYPDVFELALTADDIERIHSKGKIASLIGIEGGHVIGDSLATLRMLHALGARYMTLTHGDTNDWCDSATDVHRHGGLSPFGEEVVREMNRLGMLVDIAHVSADVMHDVLRISTAPIVATHSGADGVARHTRNIPDDVLRPLAAGGGLVMVNFFSGYVHPESARVMKDMFDVERKLKAQYPDEEEYKKAREQWKREHPYPRGTVRDVVDHIDYIVKVAGIDHVGLGGDFDGVGVLPEQLDDVSGYPFITQVLLERGYKPDAIRKILGGNLLRVLRAAQAKAE